MQETNKYTVFNIHEYLNGQNREEPFSNMVRKN